MADLVWYRSLYWRIALGFVALLATLLVLQVLVFLWISGRMDDLFPNRTPAQFAGTIATDLSAALARATYARRGRVRECAALGRLARFRGRPVGRPRGRQPACSTAAAAVANRAVAVVRRSVFGSSGRLPPSWPWGGRRRLARFRGRPFRRTGRSERAGGRVRLHQRERHGGGDCGGARASHRRSP